MCSVQAGIALYAMWYQGQVASNQADYESGVAQYNKRVSENTAQRVRTKGVEAENIQREKTARLLAKQRAQLGASNVSVDAGTALQLQQETVMLGEADALRIRSNTEYDVKSLLTQAELQGFDARNALVAGSNRRTGAYLTGASNTANTGVADKWFTPNSSANAVEGDANQPAQSYGRGK